MGLTVGELKKALADLDDDCRVVLLVEDGDTIYETFGAGCIYHTIEGKGVVKIIGAM